MEIDGGEEVATLDRYLLRLGLTEDDKLQKVLSKLLPLVIGRLASPHEASRKKVGPEPVMTAVVLVGKKKHPRPDAVMGGGRA